MVFASLSIECVPGVDREGDFKGWYANVTHPAHLVPSADPPVLIWHDLYVDLVGLPNKTYTIRDDDELEASNLDCSTNPSYINGFSGRERN